jgi:hypothetical protein
MTTTPQQPCAHPACGCKVEQSGQYCSDSCRQQRSTRSDERCECGHSDCIVEEARQRDDQPR